MAMKGIFEKTLRVGTSMCDASGRMGLNNTFALFQDIASEHAEEIGVGFEAMRKRGLFWVTARTRVRFYRRANLMEAVKAVTWPAVPGTNRCDRFYRLCAGQEILAEGRTQWCVYDLQKGAVHPANDAGYDADVVFPQETLLDEPHARLRHDFEEKDLVMRHSVCTTDVDVGQHMNNVAYLRAIENTFSVAQQRKMAVREMEILFCMPCFEGDELRMMRREIADGFEFGIQRPDGRYAALAQMHLEK